MISIVCISVLFSAFFSGIETAYIKSNRMLLELERKKNSRISKIIVFLIDHSKQLLITLTTGNIITLVLYGYYMKDLLQFLLIPNFYLLKIIGCILFSATIVLIMAELFPRIIFNIYSDQLFRFFSPITVFFYILFFPITYLIIQISNFPFFFGKQNFKEEAPILKEELYYFIDEKLEESKDQEIDTEVQFFKNALSFSDLKARDCMIYRKEIIAINVEDSIQNLAQKFTESGFSKIVVYRNSIDNIIGYVHSFDLLKKPKNIKHILFPIEVVHETTPVQEIMNRMMKKSRTISIVLDEYGGTSGLLTLEDIVEELLGNIEDEHDKLIETETELSNNHYLFSAKLKIEYLNQKYNFSIPESDEYSTLGGFITHLTEEIPPQRKEIIYKNKKFIITKVSETRIEEIELILDFDSTM